MLAAVLLGAVVIARTCGETSTDISQERAVEIATGEVDFQPTDHQIRLLKQGVQSHEVWLVGLERTGSDGALANATTVLVDANTGDVLQVQVTR